MISVKNVSFSYNHSCESIIGDISFNISSGDIVGIVGSNGAGKSTLMKLLSGNLKPLKGKIFVDGKDIHKMKDIERSTKISYIPQEQEIPFPYKVKEIVRFGLFNRAANLKKKEKEEIVLETLKKAGIYYLKDKPITEISGGEKKLVFLAKVLVQNAGIILLDEATANLDLKHTANLLRLLTESSKLNNTTVVSIIHDINIASRFCDKILMIDKCKWVGPSIPSDIVNNENIEKFYDIKDNEYKIRKDGLIEVSL